MKGIDTSQMLKNQHVCLQLFNTTVKQDSQMFPKVKRKHVCRFSFPIKKDTQLLHNALYRSIMYYLKWTEMISMKCLCNLKAYDWIQTAVFYCFFWNSGARFFGFLPITGKPTFSELTFHLGPLRVHLKKNWWQSWEPIPSKPWFCLLMQLHQISTIEKIITL